MQYQEFVNRVNERVRPGGPGEAEYAIQATLAILGEHLTGREAEGLAVQLPPELEAQLSSGNYAETAKNFSPAEFHRRVADQELCPDAEVSSEHVQAVLAVLSEAVVGAEFRDLPHRLSRETAPLPNA